MGMMPESVKDEDRTVDCIWYTGADIARNSWIDGPYTLRFDPKGADLSLLNNNAPVLNDHSVWGCESVMGKVEKAWEDGGKYYASLRMSRRPECDGLWTDIRDGILTKFSMGVELLETTEERDKAGKLTIKTATRWRPFELSLTPVPADFSTTTLAAEAPPTEAVRATSPTKEKTMAEPTVDTGGQARTEAPVAPAINPEALKQEAQKAERLRNSELHDLAAKFPKELNAEALKKYIEAGTSVQDVKNEILAAMATASERTPIQHQRPEVLRDEVETRRELMAGALLHRYHPGRYKLEGDARQYRGMNLLRLAEECLTAAGIKTRGMSPMELAANALSVNGSHTLIGDNIQRLGAMGTSDFPFILANVANKTLRAAYEAEVATWRPFCRQSNATDFKAKFVNQLGDAPNLELVPESGNFPTGSIPEARESYALRTYGKILPFTRQAIINDDMGAFTRLPELQGRAAQRCESDIVWGLITSNPLMGDGVNLFNVATHGNLITGPGTVINVANIGIARQLMRIQSGLVNADGSAARLNLVPKFLLVPTTREQIAIQYTQMPIVAATNANTNPWQGTITPIVEPRLDALAGIGTTAWYLVASPDQTDTIEFAYLEGQEGAYLETKIGFEVDGMQFKCRLDFGAKVIDQRAFVRNDGA